MAHPYIKFEHTELWHAIETAIRLLEQDNYIQCSKPREHIIGFIHHQLDARELIKPKGFEPREDANSGTV